MRTTIMTLAAGLLCCALAHAHGGQPMVPGDATGGPQGSGGVVAPPTNPNPGFAPGPGATSVGGGLPATTPTKRVVRGTSGRKKLESGTGGATYTKDLTQWDLWWGANRDRFLDLRARLGSRRTVSGSPSSHLVRGPRPAAGANSRPSAAVVTGSVVPALLELLAEQDDTDIVDSSVLALARMTDAAQSPDTARIAAMLVEQLADDDLSVRSAAVLALGVLGDGSAADLLANVAADDSAGRALVGGSKVGWLERSFAALGLGLSGHAGHVDRLVDLAMRLPDSDADVKVCTVIALGLVQGAAQDTARVALYELLADRRLDPLIKSYVPTALANLGDIGAVASLVATFENRDTDQLVLQSVAIALGRLADMGGDGWQRLGQYVDAGRDAQTRHFALIARAEIAARDAGAQPELHAAYVRGLHDELDGDGKSKQHRPWAALAAAIWSRVPEHESLDLLEHVRREYEDENDPLVRSAFAISLGLLRDTSSGDAILADFDDVKDPTFRAHAAVALGLMTFEPSGDRLRHALASKSLPPHTRMEIALGLGLMGDPSSVPDLVRGLETAETLGLVAGHARALGLIGDGRAVEPLLAVIEDERKPSLTRGFGAVALGMLCEKQALPFNARIKMNNNYRAQVPSVAEVLDIL